MEEREGKDNRKGERREKRSRKHTNIWQKQQQGFSLLLLLNVVLFNFKDVKTIILERDYSFHSINEIWERWFREVK